MSTPRTGPVSSSQTLPDPEARTLLRAKTVATRLSPEELDEIESAAKRSGKQLAAWLRDVALEAARPTPDTSELLLAEVAATRFMLLNLFHASATATQDGAHLTPETVLKIRETADSRKQQTARKLLQDFVATESKPEAINEEDAGTFGCVCDLHWGVQRGKFNASAGSSSVHNDASPAVLRD